MRSSQLFPSASFHVQCKLLQYIFLRQLAEYSTIWGQWYTWEVSTHNVPSHPSFPSKDSRGHGLTNYPNGSPLAGIQGSAVKLLLLTELQLTTDNGAHKWENGYLFLFNGLKVVNRYVQPSNCISWSCKQSVFAGAWFLLGLEMEQNYLVR